MGKRGWAAESQHRMSRASVGRESVGRASVGEVELVVCFFVSFFSFLFFLFFSFFFYSLSFLSPPLHSRLFDGGLLLAVSLHLPRPSNLGLPQPQRKPQIKPSPDNSQILLFSSHPPLHRLDDANATPHLSSPDDGFHLLRGQSHRSHRTHRSPWYQVDQVDGVSGCATAGTDMRVSGKRD